MDEDRALMRRERRRWYQQTAGLSVMALGMVLAGIANLAEPALGEVRTGQGMGLGLVVVGAGVLVTLATVRSKADRSAMAKRGTRRDRQQAARAAMLLGLPLIIVGAAGVHLEGLWALAQGGEVWSHGSTLAYSLLAPWLVVMTVLGWGKHAHDNRKWLEDEMTRAWRGAAMTVGFVGLLIGGVGVYLIGLWRPEWAMLALPIVLALSAAAAGLRFAWLDHGAATADE